MKFSKLLHRIKNKYFFSFFVYFVTLPLFLENFLKNKNNFDVENIKIDLVYKYIDVKDQEINREGLQQLKKDYDNGELKYSLRSALSNIGWLNKIFIIMPNNNISFIDKGKDPSNKLVYIKDRDILGFDSSSSITFEHNALYKLDLYNVSEYFIYFSDDYFVNKKLRKKDFFYYSEKERRIVPYVMNQAAKLSNKVFNKYKNYYLKNKYKLNKKCKQTYKDYWFQTSLAYLLLYEHFNTTSIFLPSSFDYNWHNCLPITISDLKEIHKMEEEEYIFKEELFNSKYRTNKQLTFESIYSYYFLNQYKRERGKLKGKIIDIRNVPKDIKKDYDVFCINTGPERLLKRFILNEKTLLEYKFNKHNYFEV